MRVYVNGVVFYKEYINPEPDGAGHHMCELITPSLQADLMKLGTGIRVKAVRIYVHDCEPSLIGELSDRVADELRLDDIAGAVIDGYKDSGMFVPPDSWLHTEMVFERSDYSQDAMLRVIDNVSNDIGNLKRDIARYLGENLGSEEWNGRFQIYQKNKIQRWLWNSPMTCELGDRYPFSEIYSAYTGLLHNERRDVHTDCGDVIGSLVVGHFNSRDYWKCRNCSHWYHDNYDCYEIDGDVWCQDCYENDSSSCEQCGYETHHDNTHSNMNGIYCESCWDDRRSGLLSYCDNPQIRFYDCDGKGLVETQAQKDGVPYYGVELEVEAHGSDKYELADSISNYGGYHKYLWCKEDGSLSEDGFEICTQPLTFEAWQKFDIADAVFKHRGEIKSYQTTTCGIHIHINRSAFSDIHVLKFMTFIHEYKKMTHFMSQRKNMREYNQFSQFQAGSVRKAQREMYRSVQHKKSQIKEGKSVMRYCTMTTGEKYVPVNLAHRNTIEIRVFKGNLREVSFRKNIEFLDALYYWSKNTPLTKLDIREFGDYMQEGRKKYPNLAEFVKERYDEYRGCLSFSKEIPEGLNI